MAEPTRLYQALKMVPLELLTPEWVVPVAAEGKALPSLEQAETAVLAW
jgi:hypothetical protein